MKRLEEILVGAAVIVTLTFGAAVLVIQHRHFNGDGPHVLHYISKLPGMRL